MGQSPVNAACTCCFKRAEEHQVMPGYGYGRRSSRSVVPQSELLATQAPRTLVRTGPCIVCREASADTVCLPCGHLLVCFKCSRRYYLSEDRMHPDTRCPICKQPVQHFQRADASVGMGHPVPSRPLALKGM
eukprot:g23982.t1